MIGVQTIVAPGIISFHVITPGSTVFNVKPEPVGNTFASAVIVTFPVAKVNEFPEGVTLVSILTVKAPIPKDTAFPVTVWLASAVIVKVPVPNAS